VLFFDFLFLLFSTNTRRKTFSLFTYSMGVGKKNNKNKKSKNNTKQNKAKNCRPLPLSVLH
jgi:hypothetical protein